MQVNRLINLQLKNKIHCAMFIKLYYADNYYTLYKHGKLQASIF